MNTEQAIAFWNNQRRGVFRRTKTDTIPTRRRAKAGKLGNRIERNKTSESMLVAKHPRGFSPLPKFNDERTKVLFTNYSNRVKDKQDRKR
jgi:hypothetical protein